MDKLENTMTNGEGNTYFCDRIKTSMTNDFLRG